MSTVCVLSMAMFGELVVLDLDVLVLADGVAFDLLLGRNLLAGHAIDHLPLQAVAGGAVQGVEADLLGEEVAG